MTTNKPLAAKQHRQAINTFNHQTDRLSIKKFTSVEVPHNIKQEMDPELMRYIRDPLPLTETKQRTLDKAREWTGEEQEWALLAIREKSSNDYIGMVCLRYESIINDTIEIGWRLGHNFHGKGYATEAAKGLLDFIKNQIKPHKVVAYCVAENTASSNIMLKIGMQKEGHLRQFCQLGGKWHDEAIYGTILS